MFISVFGTLVTDILTDSLWVPLELSTIVFSILLAVTFWIWYASEKTLSIHSIFTRKREIFYWLAILFTFALWTASWDLMAEGLALGYGLTGLIIAWLIVIFAFAWKSGINSILAFWMIYILTRPLGASIWDLLSQSQAHGWLGLGTTLTSIIFIAGIIWAVTYLTFTKKDVVTETEVVRAQKNQELENENKWWLFQTAIVLAILIVVSSLWYTMRQWVISSTTVNSSWLQTQTFTQSDVAWFETIATDTLSFLNNGNQDSATQRIGDLEYVWDQVAWILKSKSKSDWTLLDDQIDSVLRELRAVNPNMDSEKASLQELINLFQKY